MAAERRPVTAPPVGTGRPTESGATARAGAVTDEGARRSAPSWFVLLVTCIGQFMVVLDISVVNVALPAIHRSLGFSESGLQWIIDIYALTFGGFLLLGGRAADLFGRKKVFMAGLAIFTASSFLGGLSTSQNMLLAARAVQGLGAAILSPATLTIITTTFTEHHARTRALAAWSAVASAGGAAGTVLGGVLTDLLSWRWILFINIPVGVVTLVAASAVIAERRNEASKVKLDLAGAVTVTLGLFTLVFAIVRTDAYSWGAWQTMLPLGVAAALLAGFLLIESRVASDPLVPLRLFRKRSVAGANLVMLFVGGGIFGMWFFESLYMQDVLGYSPLEAGVAFLPQPLCIAAGAFVCSRLVARLGAKPLLIAGPVVSAIGLAWLSQVTATGGYFPIVLFGGMIAAAGVGLTFTPVAVAATADVPMHEAGLASGLVNASRQVGGSIGLAVMATIAAGSTASLLAHGAARTARSAALTHGFTRAFLLGAVVSLCAGAAGFVVPHIRPAARPGDARVPTGHNAADAVGDTAGTAADSAPAVEAIPALET